MSDTFTLNNGVVMPSLGYGVFQTPPDETADVVEIALKTGYRHVDTAAIYGNERGVGEGIRRSGIDRSEIFIETKVWASDYGYDETLHAFDKSVGKLGVEHLDLFILHQPVPVIFDRTVAAYKALETLLKDGKVRSIGISNFMPHNIDRLLAEVDVVPAINQIEVHPYFRQIETLNKDAELGILSQAWSPIGGITFYPGYGDDRVSVLENKVIVDIAAEHDKSPAQVMLRWHLQQGRSAIPKSVNPKRIAENFDVFDFELSADELGSIDALDTNKRNGPDPETMDPNRFSGGIPEA